MFHPLSRKKLCFALAAAFAASSVQAAAFDAKQCARLSQTDGVVAAQWVKAGKLPADDQAAFTGSSRAADVEFGAHCVVSGELEKRTGADGKPYYIGYQMRLPESWNGKFLFQGGGGMDGFIAPAVGATPVAGSTATPALKRGYAVVSMDGAGIKARATHRLAQTSKRGSILPTNPQAK